ncbi:MAG: isopentenyl phosphate kinase family protein [Nitrososphaerota archaeon]|nr:isopentenyl phosphate kinase family protein [Nitrososphaerota archaeon]MDG6942124.1 isopentenyl phosphate kinase family protein [Nitrososphaerota archaeon]MDG6948376.1 isopentenyl phosphate kinase family protein [Nitrososphaerota archaeon]MDG6950302.1 isopentenyl phosphate kinase family protein [Nitrososphaerota archaeon]
MAKLGGSVITDKSKPFSYRPDVVSALSEEIASSDQKVVVVHGGGSFGHVVAKQHGIGTDAGEAPAVGVAQTRGAMYELNRMVCKTMLEFKLCPYPFSPYDAISRAGGASVSSWLKGLLKEGLTPVTFGDVGLAPSGFRVISGDVIVQELAKTLEPERVVFALDVDGVYEENTRVIIPELTAAKVRRMKVHEGDDATGGMRLKLDMAAKIAAGGTSAYFVSGYRRNEFSKALRGLDFYGTVVRS